MKNDRNQCPYRHKNGNCLKIGGFCLSMDDKYCPYIMTKDNAVEILIDIGILDHNGNQKDNIIDGFYLFNGDNC